MRIGVWAPNAAFDPETKRISTGLKIDVDLIRYGAEHLGHDFDICSLDDTTFDLVFSLEKTPPKKIINAVKAYGGKIAWCVNTDLLSMYPGCVIKSELVDFYIGKTQGQHDYIASLNWAGETHRINFASPFSERPGSVDRKCLLHIAGSSPYKNSMEQLRAGIELVEAGHFDEFYLKLSSHHTTIQQMVERMKKLAKAHPRVHIIDRYLSEEEKIDLYQKTRVALCASAREGFGHYILEAASHGCQVVTTDGYPMKELLDEQVYLANAKRKMPEDENALWGFRYECKKEEVKLAVMKALADDFKPHLAVGNLQKRKDLFLKDFKAFITAANIDSSGRLSSWEVF